MGQSKTIKDHAVLYNSGLSLLAVLTASATFAISQYEGGAKTALQVSALVLAILTAIVGVFKFVNERGYKKQQEGERVTLDQALNAGNLRTALLINGAMLGTADKLRRLAALDPAGKSAEISGFRMSIVSKVCDLMQSDAPRAAYFRVQDLHAKPRVMQSGTYVDSRNRDDLFTSEFVEGQGPDQGVWDLIDRGDCDSSNDLATKRPPTWDPRRPLTYKSFVSVAVRAGNVPFGMLTANTLETDGFTASDEASIKVLARLLAAAEATAMTKPRYGRPAQGQAI